MDARRNHDEALRREIDEAIYVQPNTDGSFPPAQQQLFQALGTRRRAVVMAFPPKAAGTFLRTAVIKAVDGQLVRIVHAQAGRDATPYLPTLVRYFEGGITDKTLVTHVHMLALHANLQLMSVFGIKPIIMIRNIPDMLASYWDMLEADDQALRDGLNCHIPPHFRSMSQNAKADFIIDVLAPWYVNFYAGWLAYAGHASGTVLVTDFRDLKEKPADVVEAVLKHVGLARDRQTCEAAVADAWKKRDTLRFNKGKAGRGSAYFRAPHLNRIARVMSNYPVLANWRGVLLSERK